jgi:hypothetical protein
LRFLLQQTEILGLEMAGIPIGPTTAPNLGRINQSGCLRSLPGLQLVTQLGSPRLDLPQIIHGCAQGLVLPQELRALVIGLRHQQTWCGLRALLRA